MATHPDERPLGEALVFVASGVLGVAALRFFEYPLDKALWILLIIFVPVVWLVAVGAALAGVLMVGRQRGYRSAVVLGLAAVLGFTAVASVDLDLGYPYAYFWTHRGDFAAAAVFADTVEVDQHGEGEAVLPPGQRDLAGGRMNVGSSSSGNRSAVLWMSYASGIGYGYAYAPSARSGEVVLSSPAAVAAVAALGDGWWWVSNLETAPSQATRR